ncbi:MAG: ROK family protein [Coriobacteriales bacterium]|nr:ROK family protein [Coriobacteriales bacterium]
MVYVTGDIHGWLDIGKLTPNRWPEGQRLRHSDFLVICGDFGLLWSNPSTLEEKFFLDWLNDCPWTTLFVDGNHENYDLLDALPTCTWHGGKVGCLPGRKNIIHLLRGQVYEMGKYGRWFCMGGAPSHDRSWREEGVSWWPREMPSDSEYAEALANLDRVGWQVDYVFSHEVPRSLRRHAMARHYDPSREEDDPLTAFLQQVDDRLDKRRLKMWYAGHYHDDIMLRDKQHTELYQQIVRLGDLPDGRVHRHLPYCEESWIGIKGIGKRYREWVLSRQIEGCTITWQDNEHICLTTDSMFGTIIFHARDGHPEIVELVVKRRSDGLPIFRTRFKLKDMLRAKELFLEMAECMEQADLHGTTRVLLCCNAGVTTNHYVIKLREQTEKWSLHLDFFAMPLDEAIAGGESYDVVLVAPQVGYRHSDAVRAFPHATVVEIPDEVFATLDVKATLRMVLDALTECAERGPVGRSLAAARPLDTSKSVMVVSVTNRTSSTAIGYRVFRNGDIELDGMVIKRHADFHDIEDVLATVSLDGLDVSSLDAIGITLPGIINRASVSLPSDDESDYDLGRLLEKTYNIKVYVDNSSNAAAMGCYVSQATYDSVVFHTQHTGMVACSEGMVVDGHLVKGRLNYAGELLPLLGRMRYSEDPATLVWTYKGMREVVASYLLASICAMAPDAVYVSSALVTSVEALHHELAKSLPETRIPHLELVSDQRENTYLGELALCIDKLKHPRPHRKW